MTTPESFRRYALSLLLALQALLAGAVHAAGLEVEIERVGAQIGRLTVFVYDSAQAWDGSGEALRMQRVYPDGSDRLLVRFDGLAPGRYGVVVLHDKDGNRRFDVGPLGIPRDDYGFSNNPVVFSRPRFERIAFVLPAAGMRIRVRMR